LTEDVLTRHYTRLAEQYDDFLMYSPEFVRTLTSKMVAMLALQPEDRLVDLGGGTGMYSIDIVKQVPLEQKVVVVDPFQEMLDGIPEGAPCEPVCEGALEYSRRDTSYDKMLVKEAVHHVEERGELLANIHRQLRPGGRVLLVHVPPKLDYPVFEAALERSEGWLADPNDLERILSDVGFRVERDAVDWRHELPKETYFRMVAGQYMSVLTSFSDREMAEGLEEMRQKYADREVLEFNDHFDYLMGEKAR